MAGGMHADKLSNPPTAVVIPLRVFTIIEMATIPLFQKESCGLKIFGVMEGWLTTTVKKLK